MATVAMAIPRSHRITEVRRHVLIYLGLVPFLTLAVFPVVWMAITAIKQEPDLYRMDVVPFWFHLPPTWKNFDILFHRTSYGAWIVNTMAISFWVSAITLLTGVPAGYALARLRLPFAENLGIGIFLTYLVPPTLLFLPLSRVISQYFHLSDRLWSLVVVYPSFTIPFAIWLLMGFFKTIPQELEDAALVDGCSRIGSLVRIVFPISIPGILTVVIFTFSLVLNEFVYAITFISSSTNRTLTVGVPTDLIRGDLFNWPGIMAAILIPSIPLALIYNAFLNRFIAGFTGGAFR